MNVNVLEPTESIVGFFFVPPHGIEVPKAPLKKFTKREWKYGR